ncbi:hypothetical protein [Burkholderia sp. L27(2015)]|uniref:DUF6966 domain-containing protein n=1 Tax=Burkholderia sp. L27(2015) TaxID=1641858 RepID=UPI00131E573B|nr:hypothetical protein [Burkholderia sp. L27(2015)]
MDAKIARLCKLLADIRQLLGDVGEARWEDWIARDLMLVESLDAYGLEHFLSAFGGMGSINDLIIHPINGHQIAPSDVNATNEKLRILLGEASLTGRELLAEEQEANRAK